MRVLMVINSLLQRDVLLIKSEIFGLDEHVKIIFQL